MTVALPRAFAASIRRKHDDARYMVEKMAGDYEEHIGELDDALEKAQDDLDRVDELEKELKEAEKERDDWKEQCEKAEFALEKCREEKTDVEAKQPTRKRKDAKP